MLVKALKSFAGRHGFIRAGQDVNLEDGYARDLAKNGLVELPGKPEGAGGPKPKNEQAVPRAPYVGGFRPGANEKRPGTERPLGDGTVLSPLSSRAVQVRAKKTPAKSASGAKKAGAAKTKPPAASSPDRNRADDV